MAEIPKRIPSVPPSTEQNHHEIRKWMRTPIGKTLTDSGVHAALATSMAGHFEVDDRTLGEILMRLSSHMAGTLAEVPDIPGWMLTNLVGMAGVVLIEKGDADA